LDIRLRKQQGAAHEELHNLYSSPYTSIIKILKSGRKIWVNPVARMAEVHTFQSEILKGRDYFRLLGLRVLVF
jgi:hypothetical protein